MGLESKAENRIFELVDLLKRSSGLIPSEVEGFGRDLEDVRDEMNRTEVRVEVFGKE